MSAPNNASPDTTDLIDLLAKRINSAQAAYEVWFTLASEEKAYREFAAELKNYLYSSFFISVTNAHFSLMIVEIACLFDRNKRALSFSRLQESLEEDGRSDLAKRIDFELSSFENLVRNIKGIRNKIVAHHDLSMTEQEVFNQFGVTPNEIRDLLNTVNELTKSIYKEIVSSETAYPLARPGRFEESTFHVLGTIRDGRS